MKYISTTLLVVGIVGVGPSLTAGETNPVETQKETATIAAQSSQLKIHIRSDGKVVIEDREVSDEALVQMLATQASKDKDTAISICASEKAPLPSVSKVLDLCRKQGLTKFTLQTEQP